MKYGVGDTFKIRHGNGDLVEVTIVGMSKGQYKLEGAFTSLPMFLSEPVLEALVQTAHQKKLQYV